ncbi:MAG: hypothetical protein A4E53_01316 [Pelotomaculum sp. PtaB.Bin104]|nr:MAG: hypothetical protein A4E53_01316 [Pelotomaculum sp. PtaB.Bin104]
MCEIKSQSNDIFGKRISEIEKQNSEFKGKPVMAAQLKEWLFPLSIVLLFVIMHAIIWGLKCEVSSLRATITQLKSDNASIKSQLDAQVKQVLPAIKTLDDKTTEEFIYYVVQEGDCFETITERYYQTSEYASELAKLNNLTIHSILQIGQIIKVPKNKAYLTKEPQGSFLLPFFVL